MIRIDHKEKDLENHDRGLDYDLPRLLHRRGMLKLVAGAGLAGAGLITLGACAAATSSTSADSCLEGARHRAGRRTGGGSAQTSDTANGEIPEETIGPLPRRRVQRGERADRRAASYAATSRPASARVHDQGRGRPAGHHHDDQRLREQQVNRWRVPRSTSGTATGKGGTPSIRRRHRRELSAWRPGDRRQGPGESSPRSSRPATQAAGRTSTSRSTPAWPRRPAARTRSLRPRWR